MFLEWLRKKPKEEERWYEYRIPWMNRVIPAAFSMPVRNYETILRANGDAIERCNCGCIFSQKRVRFSVWASDIEGGFGQNVLRVVSWCPQCDAEPPETGIMRLPTLLALALSRVRK